MNIRSKQLFVGVLGTILGVMFGKLIYDVIGLIGGQHN